MHWPSLCPSAEWLLTSPPIQIWHQRKEKTELRLSTRPLPTQQTPPSRPTRPETPALPRETAARTQAIRPTPVRTPRLPMVQRVLTLLHQPTVLRTRPRVTRPLGIRHQATLLRPTQRVGIARRLIALVTQVLPLIKLRVVIPLTQPRILQRVATTQARSRIKLRVVMAQIRPLIRQKAEIVLPTLPLLTLQSPRLG